MSSKLDLQRVPPVVDGLQKLKADIEAGAEVFCSCAIARDYHVGARDAEDVLVRAEARGMLVRRASVRSDERFFIPTRPSDRLKRRLEAEGTEVVAAVDRAYGILCEAFPSFRIGTRLSEQEPYVRESFHAVFQKLQKLGYLPQSTTNSQFNHQGMTMLMEQCFPSRNLLIDCLRSPKLLDASPGSEDSGRGLRVFLCHASDDKEAVQVLCSRLIANGVRPWFDEENLLPGQDWDREIRRAVRTSDVVIVCLSPRAVTKRGYVQKEIRIALDAADEQPEGTIFIVPAKLEATDVPDRLQKWQWVDLEDGAGFDRLLAALRAREADRERNT